MIRAHLMVICFIFSKMEMRDQLKVSPKVNMYINIVFGFKDVTSGRLMVLFF